MQELVIASVAQRQFQVRLVTSFSVVALLLAIAGIYGVVSYIIAQIGPEFGIRAALGAKPRDLVRLVLGRALRPVLLGLAAGLVLSLAASTMLRWLLFGISPIDPIALGGAVIVLTTAAMLAAYLPAQRASRVGPSISLRTM